MSDAAHTVVAYAQQAQNEVRENQGEVRERIASLMVLRNALEAHVREHDEDDFNLTRAIQHIDAETSYLSKRLHWFEGKIDAYSQILAMSRGL